MAGEILTQIITKVTSISANCSMLVFTKKGFQEKPASFVRPTEIAAKGIDTFGEGKKKKKV